MGCRSTWWKLNKQAIIEWMLDWWVPVELVSDIFMTQYSEPTDPHALTGSRSQFLCHLITLKTTIFRQLQGGRSKAISHGDSFLQWGTATFGNRYVILPSARAPVLLRECQCIWCFLPGVRLSEGRGQNNQQPTPNDNNKRVVVFLCGSGIWSPQGDVLQAFR